MMISRQNTSFKCLQMTPLVHYNNTKLQLYEIGQTIRRSESIKSLDRTQLKTQEKVTNSKQNSDVFLSQLKETRCLK